MAFFSSHEWAELKYIQKAIDANWVAPVGPQLDAFEYALESYFGNTLHAVESRPVWKPMHLQPIFKDAPFFGAKIADELSKFALCLPSGTNLKSDEKTIVKETLITFFENIK